jgi:hypothetical protein
VKNIFGRWILGLSLLFTFAAAATTPADAQVVVKVGPSHGRYYHHGRRYHHVYYRNHRRYYR